MVTTFQGITCEATGAELHLRPNFAKAKAAFRYCLREFLRGREVNWDVLISIGWAAYVKAEIGMLPSELRLNYASQAVRDFKAFTGAHPKVGAGLWPYRRFLDRLLRKEQAG